MGTEISEPTQHTRTNNSNQQLEPTRDRKRQKVKPRTMALLFDTVFDLDDLVFRHPFAPSSCGSKRKQCVPGSMAKRQQWPKINLLEEEDRFVVKADVPGVPKDKLKLSVSEDGITLGFEEEESKEEGGSQGKALRRERYFRSFTRTVPLPEGVDKDKITASVVDGVLALSLPKAPESQPKAITIE